MSTFQQSVSSILGHYPGDWQRCVVTALGNHGGYSGAQLWKIEAADGSQFCLRQWPGNKAQHSHVEGIHRVLVAITRNGFPSEILPLPLRSKNGLTVVQAGDKIYELTRWMPGRADFAESSNSEKIESVASTLAEFHSACRDLDVSQCQANHLRGVVRRRQFIKELNSSLLGQIIDRLSIDRFVACSIDVPMNVFKELGLETVNCYRQLQPRMTADLVSLGDHLFQRQICVRDIWHDHVFFVHNKVSAIVDFGAMGLDNPATDIARLFGSLFQNSTPEWTFALGIYQAIRELSDLELKLIDVYDRTSTMLAGMNWLKWILIENRKFDSFVPITKRMELLVNRMRDWM